MAAPGSIMVPCPECGDPVEVTIELTTEYVEGDGLLVAMKPNIAAMAEHYTTEHCGAEVSEG